MAAQGRPRRPRNHLQRRTDHRGLIKVLACWQQSLNGGWGQWLMAGACASTHNGTPRSPLRNQN